MNERLKHSQQESRDNERMKEKCEEESFVMEWIYGFVWAYVEKLPAHYTYDASKSLPLITITFAACALIINVSIQILWFSSKHTGNFATHVYANTHTHGNQGQNQGKCIRNRKIKSQHWLTNIVMVKLLPHQHCFWTNHTRTYKRHTASYGEWKKQKTKQKIQKCKCRKKIERRKTYIVMKMHKNQEPKPISINGKNSIETI